ncbi:MAG: hypothetical protein ABIJ05_05460 [Patescibacteria group bacterium]
MKKKTEKLILFGLIGLLVITSLIFLSSTLFSNSKIGEKISPLQIIKFSDENSSITITKNNLDKSANIDMTFYMESDELKNDFMDLTEFMTDMMCGIMVLAFFDEEGLAEFNEQINQWNEMEGVIENEKGQEQGTPEGNILEGYEIKKVKVAMQDKTTRQMISDCTITGKEEGDIQLNYYQ